MSRPAPAESARRATADIVATVVLFAAQLVLLCAVAVLSLFAAGVSVLLYLWEQLVLAGCTSTCPEPTDWSHGSGTIAVIVGGFALAVVVSVGGTIFAAVRHRIMWIWPAIGLVILAGDFLLTS